MELTGKTVLFLGDSITAGHGASDEAHNYVSLLGKDLALKAAVNCGIGGTRIARQIHPSENPDVDLDFVSRAPALSEHADVVAVFGGTNDYGHGDAPFGTFADRTPDTFYGACHALALALLEKYPGRPVVFFTPLHRTGEDIPNSQGKVLADYVRAIREVAAYYALPVLDLFAESGIQPNVPIVRERLAPDGLHPNDAGYRVLADRIGAFLRRL